MTLGRYPVLTLAEARDKAHAAMRQIEQGVDPVPTKQERQRQEEQRIVYRFEDVVASFVALHCQRQNREVTAKDTARILKNRFVSRWAERDVREITRIEIIRLLDAIVEAGTPSAANRELSAIRKFFNWCVERGVLDASPCHGVKKPTKDRSRDRVLDHDEIRTIWQTADRAAREPGRRCAPSARRRTARGLPVRRAAARSATVDRSTPCFRHRQSR